MRSRFTSSEGLWKVSKTISFHFQLHSSTLRRPLTPLTSWDTWTAGQCHYRSTIQQLEKCSAGWYHFWAFWSLCWCPATAGWRSSAFPLYHLSKLFTEEDYIRPWFGRRELLPTPSFKTLSSESVEWPWANDRYRSIRIHYFSDTGLIITVHKTGYMTVNCHPHPTLQVYGEPINHVTDFHFLGSKISSTASDFKRCKALALSACWKLERLWGRSQLSNSTKWNLLYSTCMTILLYGGESTGLCST